MTPMEASQSIGSLFYWRREHLVCSFWWIVWRLVLLAELLSMPKPFVTGVSDGYFGLVSYFRCRPAFCYHISFSYTSLINHKLFSSRALAAKMLQMIRIGGTTLGSLENIYGDKNSFVEYRMHITFCLQPDLHLYGRTFPITVHLFYLVQNVLYE